MAEGDYHRRAKLFILDLVQKSYPHYDVYCEDEKIPMVKEGMYTGFDYTYDIYCEYVSCRKCHFCLDRVDIEIDTPGAGHGTKITIPKDHWRDVATRERGIRVVRFNTYHIIGNGRIRDTKVFEEEMALLPPSEEDRLYLY